MTRFARWYGSGPLHLLVLIASFALTGYAMVRLFAVQPWEVAIWFVGAAILHDLILLPLYSLADLSAFSVLRHRAVDRPTVPWINYLRVPVFLSGLLLLVWFPLVLRLAGPYPGDTGLSDGVYLGRWLAITGALFAASAVAFAMRLRRLRRAGRGDKNRPAAGHGAAP
ncbi:hypothetical protein FB563_0414 [Streptomyces puniciscabiei]|uniref:Uncharacterized protein n=1 Tax=Streptomyces puniciscabiei TaxID=164348 RepID=A0A542U8V6_9ACTN|nr:hypothetical protein [Streptomyces puniciscabiei]TQK95509.1 hypothetical protein FB563_0414 [Streptomyces puniciscabiei]